MNIFNLLLAVTLELSQRLVFVPLLKCLGTVDAPFESVLTPFSFQGGSFFNDFADDDQK